MSCHQQTEIILPQIVNLVVAVRILGLDHMLMAIVSAVNTYRGIDKGQPCLSPLSKLINAVSQPFVLTELETEL